jgi:hypothetical protein
MVILCPCTSNVGPTQFKMKFITQYLLYTPLTINFTETHLLMEIKVCVLIEDTHTHEYLSNIYFSQYEWIMHKEPHETFSQELRDMFSEP